jgi:ribonuclease Z
MVLEVDRRIVLIDCGTNPIVRLRQVGIDAVQVTDLLLTHFHPDHVGSLPLFLLNSWLLGRKDTLRVYGLAEVLERARKMMELFDWQEWPGFFPVSFFPVSPKTRATVLQTDEVRILSSPVTHMIPNIGLRFESLKTGRALAYSGDTMLCTAVIDLADQAEILIHEAAGDVFGHSSAEQAGQVAHQAGVKHLYLIHYPNWDSDPFVLIQQARQAYAGLVELARDLMVIDL